MVKAGEEKKKRKKKMWRVESRIQLEKGFLIALLSCLRFLWRENLLDRERKGEGVFDRMVCSRVLDEQAEKQRGPGGRSKVVE